MRRSLWSRLADQDGSWAAESTKKHPTSSNQFLAASQIVAVVGAFFPKR